MPVFPGPLAVLAVLVVSGLYTAGACWWRRRQARRGVQPGDVFPGFQRFPGPRRRVSVEEILAQELGPQREAESVVYEANARLAHLYVEPAELSPGARALEEARAQSSSRP